MSRCVGEVDSVCWPVQEAEGHCICNETSQQEQFHGLFTIHIIKEEVPFTKHNYSTPPTQLQTIHASFTDCLLSTSSRRRCPSRSTATPHPLRNCKPYMPASQVSYAASDCTKQRSNSLCWLQLPTSCCQCMPPQPLPKGIGQHGGALTQACATGCLALRQMRSWCCETNLPHNWYT
jgi:hypothetical protein